MIENRCVKEKKNETYNVINSVKGGCGKTTFSISLAWYLMKMQEKMDEEQNKAPLLIDMDLQGTAMKTIFNPEDVKNINYLNEAVNTRDPVLNNYIIKNSIENNSHIDTIFSNPSVAAKSQYRETYKNNYSPVISYNVFRHGLYELLKEVDKLYDDVIFDMPPNSDGFANSAIDCIFRKAQNKDFKDKIKNMFLITTIDSGHITATINELKHLIQMEEHMEFDNIFIVVNYFISPNSEFSMSECISNFKKAINECEFREFDYKKIHFIKMSSLPEWLKFSIDGLGIYKNFSKVGVGETAYSSYNAETLFGPSPAAEIYNIEDEDGNNYGTSKEALFYLLKCESIESEISQINKKNTDSQEKNDAIREAVESTKEIIAEE